MSEEQQKNSAGSKVFELAKTKRHIHLMEKVQQGKVLTSTELKELQLLEGADVPSGVVDSQEAVAQIFGVSARTISNWIRDGMPRRPDGRYELKEIYAWKAERDGPANEDTQGLKHWSAEHRQYKALIAKLEYQQKLGQLVTREEVEAGRIQRILTIKSALLALPQRLAAQVVGLDEKKAEAIIRKRIEDIIIDFSRGGDGIVEEKTGGQDATPAAEGAGA